MSEAGVVDERSIPEPVAVGPGEPGGGSAGGATAASDAAPAGEAGTVDAAGDGPGGAAIPAPVLSGADASLLALVDRLTGVLERNELGELEVAAGGTTIVLRAPSAIERPVGVAVPGPADGGPAGGPAADAAVTPATPAPAARPSVRAPLTGIFYGAPSPGATAYVAVGDHVAVGQIIGLIEAMKLFNEIKSDLAGRVARICVDNGALVKARQPLIEVDPA